MSVKQKSEFNSICEDILNNSEFKKLDEQIHHGITRYDHSLRVARNTYKISKALRLDYKSATRGALIHDFFLDTEFSEEDNRLKLHPEIAVINAKKHFNINYKEENIIKSHMFPLNKTLPKCAESWLVSTVDKVVALVEGYRFKFYLQICILAIFFFNMITLQK